MSLSLEVKKFINSEHTGEFVNVTLPSELPVRREEVRTVHRDTAAAESAKRRARDLANARESAKRAAQSAEEALSDAHRDERAAEKELRERQSRRSALTPEYDEKNGIAAAAQSLFNQRKAESDRCYAVYSEFEKALRKAAEESDRAEAARVSHKALPVLTMINAAITGALGGLSSSGSASLSDQEFAARCTYVADGMAEIRLEVESLLRSVE